MNESVEFIKEQKKVEHANYKKTCKYCGREFDCVRYDAKFCTPLCRVKYNQNGALKKSIKEASTKKTEPKQQFRKFDFSAALGSSPADENWLEFRQYLLEQFGWTKASTISYKGVKKLVDQWNKNHKRQIVISRTLVPDPGYPKFKISRIIFFVN